ncbi:MAG: HAD-IA family hydrolase, partial [Alphaproteobacteria bacterium]
YKALITALGERVEPIVGVFDAITTIRGAGCSVCVASQGPVEKIRASLTRVGLWRTFSAHCYSGKLVERSKPFPDLFLHAAHENDVLPSRCAVIEDTETGVRAGIAANMSVFAYCSADKADTMRALGGGAFHSMTDLPHCLGLAA